jgi:hypothetical protein
VPLFRRSRDDDEVAGPNGDERDSVAAEGSGAPAVTAPKSRPQGPWDAADVDDDVERVDLGAIQLPVPEGCEVRLDVQDDQVVAATLVDGRTALQIHAFAAPRSEGIWDDVRREIAESLREAGGSAEDAEGPLGLELRARIPAPPEPGQPPMMQPARFLGVDGPRWFLRGLMTGVGATDQVQARHLEDAFRGIVVVRGGEAMAPRDLLPLRLPREAQQQLTEAAEQQRPTLDMLQRGPEITETR